MKMFHVSNSLHNYGIPLAALGVSQFPPGFTAAGALAGFPGANFAAFRPQYSLPGQSPFNFPDELRFQHLNAPW